MLLAQRVLVDLQSEAQLLFRTIVVSKAVVGFSDSGAYCGLGHRVSWEGSADLGRSLPEHFSNSDFAALGLFGVSRGEHVVYQEILDGLGLLAVLVRHQAAFLRDGQGIGRLSLFAPRSLFGAHGPNRLPRCACQADNESQ